MSKVSIAINDGTNYTVYSKALLKDHGLETVDVGGPVGVRYVYRRIPYKNGYDVWLGGHYQPDTLWFKYLTSEGFKVESIEAAQVTDGVAP